MLAYGEKRNWHGRLPHAKPAAGIPLVATRPDRHPIREILRGPALQPKLASGATGDAYESEADRVAEQVMRMPEPQLQSAGACSGNLPNGRAGPPGSATQRIETTHGGSAPMGKTGAPALVNEVLAEPGQPLQPAARAFFEPRFGYDFSAVRVHSDASAGRSALEINARAYTVGQHLVFGTGKLAPETDEGRRLLAHELTHVVQQDGGGSRIMRQSFPMEEPESLTRSLDPSALSDAALERETSLLQTWLREQTTGTEETERLSRILSLLEAEMRRRAGGGSGRRGPGTPRPGSHPVLRPPPQTGGASGTVPSAPTTTRVSAPATEASTLAPNEATRQRLMEIVTQGGPMPAGTRVIGAAIVEVEGYRGAREIRAISSAQTDPLGEGAPVAHAATPATRTLSASRSIGGASLRREFPFSHINDAEIKLFETIAANMPRNAVGRISFLTIRSRQGGQILEPIPACSSCTNATFQVAGTFRGVQVASYAAVHPTASISLEPAGPGATPPGAAGATYPRSAAPSSTTQSTRSTQGLTEEIGAPDMRGLWAGGPSARGQGIGAGITLGFMGANFVLNLINDHIQTGRVNAALREIEPVLRAKRRAHPEFGVLLVFYYSQVEAPPESLMRPGAAFGHLEHSTGRTPDEAREAREETRSYRKGPSASGRTLSQEVWIPPLIAPSVRDIRTPFPGVALGTFLTGHWVLQDVEWGGVSGFDDEGVSSLSPAPDANPHFLILRVPSVIAFFNGGFRHEVSIPVEQRNAHAGGQIPVVNLDPVMPFSNVSAACVFPADDATAALFSTAVETRDNLGQLGIYRNFGRVRWIRPENINVLRRI
jgi:hypothetical protein